MRPTRYIPWMLLGLAACLNPFAPAYRPGDPLEGSLGDPRTLEGFFARFKSAYELRDIRLYEPLLDSNFVFIYYDFDTGTERTWGFSTELKTTGGLFQSAENLRLIWRQILYQEEDSLRAQVVRQFSLSVVLRQGDVLRGEGNVNFTLTRRRSDLPWKLLRWRDESQF
ncbi:MAG: hypothetical protein N2561_05540 [Bacteroidetes bacterium]|nr:hypothetical protein [Rhodothermia bacterium]MCS7154857.1 hypothetical protein [Bacteroidota bacterium]MCX7906985.1 hypothetical protein [Bacteroidota bacterium]MDW8137651.1 hypothetical protein [Bacteroidota bacterium]MDW8285395.1 hypothetical protein [Bacteroidota bacterium]